MTVWTKLFVLLSHNLRSTLNRSLCEMWRLKLIDVTLYLIVFTDTDSFSAAFESGTLATSRFEICFSKLLPWRGWVSKYHSSWLLHRGFFSFENLAFFLFELRLWSQHQEGNLASPNWTSDIFRRQKHYVTWIFHHVPAIYLPLADVLSKSDRYFCITQGDKMFERSIFFIAFARFPY